MDHAKIVAQRLFEVVFPGSRMVYRHDQSRSVPDFDLHYSDGRMAVVEVTSSMNSQVAATNAAIVDRRKGGMKIPTKCCEKGWHIHPEPNANINAIRARADEYLAALENAGFRDPDKTLDNVDFTFNPKINRSLIFDLATGAFIGKREDALFLGPGGTGKSHLAQAIGQAAIQQGYRVLYRETHVLLDELAEAIADGTRREYVESVSTVPLLIIDDFGMRKLPHRAAEDLLEIIMRRYERFSTLLTSNRPVDDWGKLLGDVAAVSAMLDRLLHHGHVLKCGPRSWRTKASATS